MRRSILVLLCAGVALAQDTPTVPGAHVKAGGVDLVLPSPAADFSDVGDRLKTTVFDLLAPSTNRLLAAYLPVRTLDQIAKGHLPNGFDLYAMIEVPRQAEYLDCTPEAFVQVLQGMGEGMDKALDSEQVGAVRAEMQSRLKSIGAKPVELGRPETLGTIFRKKDAAGVAMLMAVKSGETSVTLACAFSVLRVRSRVLFAYLYRKYESPDTVEWARKTSEAWADAILARNAAP